MPAKVGFTNNTECPKIRFADDVQSWETKKINSLLKEYSERNSDMYPCVAVGRYGIRRREEIYDKELSSNIGNNKVIRKNTLTIGMGSKQIDIGILCDDKIYSVSPAYHTFNIINSDSKFLESVFQKENERLSLAHMIIGARQGKSVDMSGFMNDSISLPSSHVQSEIASLFSRLDASIASETKTVEKLRVLKSAMLQNMFPKDGERVPEIRFPGFAGDWEQRKLGEVTSVAPFKPYLKDAMEEGDYVVIQQGDKPVLGYADGAPFTDYEKVTLFGDHTLSLYKPKSPFFVATDGLKILYSDGIDGSFYYYLLEKYKPGSEGYKRHFSILKECECCFPKNKEEQRAIGGVFSNIDKAITLHQCKCEKLVQIKRAMLEKMFL